MKILSVNFITSAVAAKQYPQNNYPEIAFIGRSNVGKSTFINSLVNRKKLVKTSSTPGKTQLINFFSINDLFVFVDLPGYGYAKVPEVVQAKWQNMIETYLTERKQLKGVIHLIDSRHPPTKNDVAMYEWLQYHKIKTMLIGTKIDKIPKSKVKTHEKQIKEGLFLDKTSSVCLFSAKTGEGKNQAWNNIEELLKPY